MLPYLDMMQKDKLMREPQAPSITDIIQMAHNQIELDGRVSFTPEDGDPILLWKRSDKPYTYYFVIQVGKMERDPKTGMNRMKLDDFRIETDSQLVRALEYYGFKGFGLVSREYWMGR